MSVFKNIWSDYHKWYKYPKFPKEIILPVGDCRATIEVINEIAEGVKK